MPESIKDRILSIMPYLIGAAPLIVWLWVVWAFDEGRTLAYNYPATWLVAGGLFYGVGVLFVFDSEYKINETLKLTGASCFIVSLLVFSSFNGTVA
jgi:hypothetical protein